MPNVTNPPPLSSSSIISLSGPSPLTHACEDDHAPLRKSPFVSILSICGACIGRTHTNYTVQAA